MGNIPEVLKSNSFKKISNSLLHIKLAKLRDYFASFKSICDNFSIDLTQFQHIFGAGQSSFVIWDTDNNGLIDSLQLFAGIAILSNTRIEDKIRFLFDMFDFNELDYLELIQVQFMIFCVCSASFKIYSINTQIENEQIEDFVKDIFFQLNKITVADLIRKAKEDKKVQQFFAAIQNNSSDKVKPYEQTANKTK